MCSTSGADADDHILAPCLLRTLLTDKTTGRNLSWGTDAYVSLGEGYGPDEEMSENAVMAGEGIVRPRIAKPLDEQLRRTRDNAEVFTPAWVCNAQNNAIDEAWFGQTDVFNTQKSQGWTPTTSRIGFPEGKTWMDYVDNRVLEISCGEAPYLVSRYDAVTGKTIPVNSRIGLLDRKLRVVTENAETENEWLAWSLRAFESSYGYDYQGDNVLLARKNLLHTYIDYFTERFGRMPDTNTLKPIANVIAWNIWQMDGFDYTVPYAFTDLKPASEQGALFELESDAEQGELPLRTPVKAKVYDWRAKKSEIFGPTLMGKV